MTNQIDNPKVTEGVHLAKAALFTTGNSKYNGNLFRGQAGDGMGKVWSLDTDKLDFQSHQLFSQIIQDCRFYYRYDPLAKIVIQKMVDLAINDLIVTPEPSMSKTELSIFNAVKNDVLEFLASAADEYLVTGLVIPEINFTRVTTDFLREKEIGRISTMLYPTDLWLRNSSDIEIKTSAFSSRNSYFIVIPEETIFFIMNGGQYPDGNKDTDLYNSIVSRYPDFVKKIRAGETKLLLDNPTVILGKVLKDSPYPIPYMFSALENMKHKRNLKKMDYSIAARVISAILHIKVGSDEYPITEEDQAILNDLEVKFKRNNTFTNDDIERVFTLATNHVTELKWIFPETAGLLDQKKYESVNQDILVSFGFPKILVTGETERSFSSDANIATLSPIQTLETMRKKLLTIVRKVFVELQKQNSIISTVPNIYWKPISLMSPDLFINGLKSLYETGNLSRESYAQAFGYDIKTEFSKREEEQLLMKKYNLPEFAPVAHSNTPNSGGNTSNNTQNSDNNVG